MGFSPIFSSTQNLTVQTPMPTGQDLVQRFSISQVSGSLQQSPLIKAFKIHLSKRTLPESPLRESHIFFFKLVRPDSPSIESYIVFSKLVLPAHQDEPHIQGNKVIPTTD